MSMQCPICDGLAEELPNTIDGKSIRCPGCGDFDVSGTVYDAGLLEWLDPSDRDRALENAKRSAPQGHRPMITTTRGQGGVRRFHYAGSKPQS